MRLAVLGGSFVVFVVVLVIVHDLKSCDCVAFIFATVLVAAVLFFVVFVVVFVLVD